MSWARLCIRGRGLAVNSRALAFPGVSVQRHVSQAKRWHLDGVVVIQFSRGRSLGKMLVWKSEGVVAGIVGYTVILVLMWHVRGS